MQPPSTSAVSRVWAGWGCWGVIHRAMGSPEKDSGCSASICHAGQPSLASPVGQSRGSGWLQGRGGFVNWRWRLAADWRVCEGLEKRKRHAWNLTQAIFDLHDSFQMEWRMDCPEAILGLCRPTRPLPECCQGVPLPASLRANPDTLGPARSREPLREGPRRRE